LRDGDLLRDQLSAGAGHPGPSGPGNLLALHTEDCVLTDIGAVDLAVPRNRNGTFEPQIARKGQTRLKV
jgi:transposase-like protein